MAVVFVNSDQITTQNSGALANSFVSKAELFSEIDIVPIVAADSIASIYRIFRIPSNARLSSLSLFNTAITGAAANIGLYDTPTTNSGAVIDADFFAIAQTLATVQTGLNVLTGNVLTPINRARRVWETLGLPIDPNRMFDVALTLTAAATATGTAGLTVAYVV